MSSKRQLFFLVLILLLAAASRIIGIQVQSLWIDEGFTWHLSQYHDPLKILRQDVHPPLYFMMMSYWVKLAGTSILSMRFFSVLPSLISVAVSYQLAREAEKQAGLQSRGVIPLVATLLMALMDAENTLSKEVRSYTWHVLWASLSIWGFLRWLRLSGWKNALLWLSATIALIYTFYLGAFIGVAQGLYALCFLHASGQETNPLFRFIGRKRLEAFGILLFAALSLIPVLLFLAGEQSGNISRGEVIRPDAYGFWLNDFRLRYFTNQWALMLGLFGLGLVQIREGKVRLEPVRLGLFFCFAIPLTLFLLLNHFVPTYQPNRVTQIVPVIPLLIAFGLWYFPRLPRLFLISVILVYSITTVDFWRIKPLWREFVAETSPYIAPTLPLLVEIGGDDYDPRYHYLESLPASYDTILRQTAPNEQANPIIGLTTWRHLESESYVGGLPAYLDSQEHLWLLYWSSDTGALDWLKQFGFVQTANIEADFNADISLRRYDRLPENHLARYENGLILHDALLYTDGTVELFWSIETALTEDFTFSVYAQDNAGNKVTQVDSPPFAEQGTTNTWHVGEIRLDVKRLAIENSDNLQFYLVVYRTGDASQRLKLEDGADSFRIVGDNGA